MNVRKRAGVMGPLSTTQKPNRQVVSGSVSSLGKFCSTNNAIAIDNSVAIKPANVGPSRVDNAVSGPGKF